jgi:hypothetical protein
MTYNNCSSERSRPYYAVEVAGRFFKFMGLDDLNILNKQVVCRFDYNVRFSELKVDQVNNRAPFLWLRIRPD